MTNNTIKIETSDHDFTPEEVTRYSRHLILPEVGVSGQQKLKSARVLLVGTGGLGSPLSLYLAAAGVGHIGLIDFDRVDTSNLQRQVVHATSDIGKPKVASAKRRLLDINPLIEVATYDEPLSADNARAIIGDYDLVADGTDNFATRYLINDACVLLGKPNVFGSIYRFEGQASVFGLADGPCYRCLYPEPPPAGLVPSCAEGGVLGVLPGIIGTIQAIEVIKLIIGQGDPLAGRLLVFDALPMRFRELRVDRNPDCPVCGTHPTITDLADETRFCSPEEAQATPQKWDLTVEAARQKIEHDDTVLLLDVREPFEHELYRLTQTDVHIPIQQLSTGLSQLNQEQTIIVYCRTGRRSAHATELLRQQGFGDVWNLAGGLQAWARKYQPDLPVY